VALEDPWRQGGLLEAYTVLLEPGLRWIGAGGQAGIGAVRLDGDVFMFSASDMVRTVEATGGGYGGTSGGFDATETTARIQGLVTAVDNGRWKAGVLLRVSGLFQRLPDVRHDAMGVEGGAQAQWRVGGGKALTGWILTGPFGKEAGYSFSGRTLAGLGVMGVRERGFLGGAEGYAGGLEGESLAGGPTHGGLGVVYWFGSPNAQGLTLFVRTGARYAQGASQVFQPRAGLGFLWRGGSRLGVQLDYAYAPAGDLGSFQYAALGIRFPPSEPKQPPVSPVPPMEQEKPAPATEVPAMPVPPPAEEKIIYFCPQEGEKARATVEAREESDLSVSLWDAEGRNLIRTLIDKLKVAPGSHQVEWDGLLEYGQPAPFDVTYMLRISVGIETRYVKVVAKARR
jgi:hypothetical protein